MKIGVGPSWALSQDALCTHVENVEDLDLDDYVV
jgi:hypothetical protein